MEFWIMIAVALVVSAIGFKQYIWFFSIGYGLSIAALGITMLIIFHASLNVLNILLCALFIVYGLRLGGYLAIREFRSASYRPVLDSATKNSNVPIFARFALWITVAVLYVFMIAPVFFRMQSGAVPDVFGWIGLGLMICGALTEAVADMQKQRAKAKNPHQVVTTGLYSIVRCPNYLGELVMWTGVLISGLSVLSGFFEWAISIVGWLGIVYVMFSGARRLELRQNQNYADSPEYQNYHDTVPIIIPFVPLRSVANIKWLKA